LRSGRQDRTSYQHRDSDEFENVSSRDGELIDFRKSPLKWNHSARRSRTHVQALDHDFQELPCRELVLDRKRIGGGGLRGAPGVADARAEGGEALTRPRGHRVHNVDTDGPSLLGGERAEAARRLKPGRRGSRGRLHVALGALATHGAARKALSLYLTRQGGLVGFSDRKSSALHPASR
jgi:hypothetical protein